MRRIAAAAGAAILIVLVAAPPASAHATLAASSPADGSVLAALPGSVTLTFDEPVRPVAADVEVLDPDGRNTRGAVTGTGEAVTVALRPDAAQGTYTLSWRVISADSHPVGGALTFSVGHPTKPAAVTAVRADRTVAALFTVARFAGFAGFAVLAGAVAFCFYGLRSAAETRGVRLLVAAGWTALVAGTFGSLLLQGPYAAGGGFGALGRAGLLGQTLSTPYGTALSVRVLLLAVLPALLMYGASRTRPALVAAAFVALAATWSAAGHAATGAQPAGTLPADMAHLCAMALWLGGLVAVALTMRARREDPVVISGVDRFSAVAAGSVAVLTATGLYQGRLRVGSPQALFATAYGITLTGKVAVVCAVLAVAFFSRRTLRRRSAGGLLARLVAIEAAGAVVVVAVTAFLVELEPAGTALAAEPVALTGRYGTGTIRVRLPARTRGLTTAAVSVRDAAGHPRDVPELDVAWSLPSREIGPVGARVTRTGTGRYTAVTAPLTAAGRWRIAVTVRTSDIDEATVLLSQTLR